MFIPSETVAFLPSKQDPDACAVCVTGQPHQGTHREDLPHAMCDAAYGRLCQIVAGEGDRTPKRRITRKAPKPPMETTEKRQRDKRKYLNANRPPTGRHGPKGTVYACATEGCMNRLVVPGGRGATPDWCVACMYSRRTAKQRARYQAKHPQRRQRKASCAT